METRALRKKPAASKIPLLFKEGKFATSRKWCEATLFRSERGGYQRTAKRTFFVELTNRPVCSDKGTGPSSDAAATPPWKGGECYTQHTITSRVMSKSDFLCKALLSVTLAVCLCISAACSLSPKYTRPSVPVPNAYKELGTPGIDPNWKPADPGDERSHGKWWEAFDDRKLSELENKLNISNQNIAAAAANVQAARSILREARAQYAPTLSAVPAIANSRLSSAYGQTIGVTYSTFSLPFEASWEPDVFGRVRSTVAVNTFAAQASAADLESVRLSAQAELATDYFELRLQDSLKQLLDSTVAAYKESFEITRSRYLAGLESDEAVAQAEAQWKGAQAQDTNLGVLRTQQEHAIAVLTGETPSSFSIAPQELNANPPSIPLGIPSQLLERRPDIAAAERTVEQANAQIGIAQSAFFPVFALTGTAGLQSLSFASWLNWPSRVWSVGPSLAETIFDGGLRRATVQQYKASYDSTVANYRQTVLTAFQQVEDNLSALRVLTEVIEQQDAATAAAARSLEEAVSRYTAGIDPYLNVITAQTVLLNGQEAAVNFRAQQIVASVQLVKALGGGWNTARLPAE